jgi:hypothetical protein
MKRRGFPAELLERRVVLHKMSRAQMEASAQPKRAQRAIRPARVSAFLEGLFADHARFEIGQGSPENARNSLNYFFTALRASASEGRNSAAASAFT